MIKQKPTLQLANKNCYKSWAKNFVNVNKPNKPNYMTCMLNMITQKGHVFYTFENFSKIGYLYLLWLAGGIFIQIVAKC